MTRLALVLAFVLSFSSSASAQLAEPADPAAPVEPSLPLDDPDRIPGLDETSPGYSPTHILAPVNVVEGNGVKIGEGTSLYPMVGLDTGFISNVFYEATSTTSAGILRLMAGVGTGSLSAARLAPRAGGTRNLGSVQHRAELRLGYDFWLSGNDFVTAQDGLSISALARGVFGPRRPWSFLYFDNFDRIIRSANYESTVQTNRDMNRLSLGVQYAPEGRSIRGMLTYSNTLDIFENSQQSFADRMQNVLALTGAWRFRPYTVLFATLSQGYYFGLGDASMQANPKVSSYPLMAYTGIQTLLTLKTSVIAKIGYTNGFYSQGPSYSSVLGGLEVGYSYSPLGRATASYEYRHDDSINANFYRDHLIRLTLEQQFVPFFVTVAPELRFRHYDGIMTLVPGIPDQRDDIIYGVTAGIRYNFRNSLAMVLQYRLAAVETDYRYTIDGKTDDPSWARHELILGLRAAM